MKLLKPTYRLSQAQYFLYTLACCVATMVVIPISLRNGGSSGWIGLLLALLIFLHYVVGPRLRDMGHSQMWALTLLTPGLILVVRLYIQWSFLALLSA